MSLQEVLHKFYLLHAYPNPQQSFQFARNSAKKPTKKMYQNQTNPVIVRHPTPSSETNSQQYKHQNRTNLVIVRQQPNKISSNLNCRRLPQLYSTHITHKTQISSSTNHPKKSRLYTKTEKKKEKQHSSTQKNSLTCVDAENISHNQTQFENQQPINKLHKIKPKINKTKQGKIKFTEI